ncbi:MAG: tryptophan synthase subunit alpha [Candidatus Helarchaeota archaeon]
MNSIDQVFKIAKEKNEGVFIPFVTLGDPNSEMTLKIVKVLDDNGADIIELGIPFSDPIADGPTIQASTQRALKNGMNTDLAFELIGQIRKFTNIPIIFLTYYNIVLQRGLEDFFNDSKKFGVQGIVIPDLPIEEAAPALEFAKTSDVHIIFMVAPTTNETRFNKILEFAGGFIYFMSILGTTGARKTIEQITADSLLRFLPISNIPIAVGFGISRTEHVKKLLNIGADGVIIGSAIIKIIQNNLNNFDRALIEVGNLVNLLKNATKKEET